MHHSSGITMNFLALKRTPKTNGFTVVELVVIVVVLVILITIVGVSYTMIVDQSREESLRNDLKSTSSSIAKYRADNGAYPTVAMFNSSAIEKSQSTEGTTYTYTYDSGAGSYCLQATHLNQTFFVRSGNSEPASGTC